MVASIKRYLACAVCVFWICLAIPLGATRVQASPTFVSTPFEKYLSSETLFTARTVGPQEDGYVARTVRVENVWKGEVPYEFELLSFFEDDSEGTLLLISANENQVPAGFSLCAGPEKIEAYTRSLPDPIYNYSDAGERFDRPMTAELMQTLLLSGVERERLNAWAQIDSNELAISKLLELGDVVLERGFPRETALLFDYLLQQPQPIVVSGLAQLVRRALDMDPSNPATDRILKLVSMNALYDSATSLAIQNNFVRQLTPMKLEWLGAADIDRGVLTELVVESMRYPALNPAFVINSKRIQDRRLIPSLTLRVSAAPSLSLARALGVQGGDAVPALLHFLESPKCTVRWAAAIGLGETETDTAPVMRALRIAAEDEDWDVRLEAALSLERLAEAEGWPWYELWIGLDYEAAEYAISFLEELATGDAYGEFAKLIWHPTLGENAISALYMAEDAKAGVALPALRDFVKTGPEALREDAQDAIEDIEEAIEAEAETR